MRTTVPKHNVAIVGCGSMGVENIFEPLPYTYSMAGAVLKHPQARLVSLIDTNEEKLRDVAMRLQIIKQIGIATHTTLEDAVEFGRHLGIPIDIVCCAAGPEVNAEIITKAQSLGIRGIYCEKPLTLSLAEADRLAEIEAQTGLKVAVNYTRNFDTHHRAVIDYIRKGGLGALLCVRCLYKGGIIAVAPHTFALLHLLFGKPKEVMGYYSPLINGRAPEDPNIDAVLRYHFEPEGRDINVTLTATGRGLMPDGSDLKNDTYLYEFEFTGTKGRISILEQGVSTRYERMESSRVFGSLGEIMPYETNRIPFDLKAKAPYEPMIEGFAELVGAVEKGTSTSANAALARDAEEVAHALSLSAANNRSVLLPLANRERVFARAVAGVNSLKKEHGVT